MKLLRPSEVQEFPEIKELTPEELAQAYKLAREAFSAEDLQKYTENDECSPLEEFLEELEEQQGQFEQKSS